MNTPTDIVLKASHSHTAVDSYISQYEQIKKLIQRGLDTDAIRGISGRNLKVV